MSQPIPAVFVSHGAPTLPLEDNASRRFLRELGQKLPRPKAILAVSAHWQTRNHRVTSAALPETIHDFFGFPQSLYKMKYPVAGDPTFAQSLVRNLEEAGFHTGEHPSRGLDHGAWSPLMLMFPEANIPTVQLSLQLGEGTLHHHNLGRALSNLRQEGVLILASGGAVHNLAVWRKDSTLIPEPAARFETWLVDQVISDNREALFHYRTHPDAAWAHPSEEHLLPLFVAMGAGGQGEVLHRQFLHGGLAMTAFSFA